MAHFGKVTSTHCHSQVQSRSSLTPYPARSRYLDHCIWLRGLFDKLNAELFAHQFPRTHRRTPEVHLGIRWGKQQHSLASIKGQRTEGGFLCAVCADKPSLWAIDDVPEPGNLDTTDHGRMQRHGFAS